MGAVIFNSLPTCTVNGAEVSAPVGKLQISSADPVCVHEGHCSPPTQAAMEASAARCPGATPSAARMACVGSVVPNVICNCWEDQEEIDADTLCVATNMGDEARDSTYGCTRPFSVSAILRFLPIHALAA
jgi:hypothetical protein